MAARLDKRHLFRQWASKPYRSPKLKISMTV
jgi:hypothetical protein